jgi:hypothetical protein
MLTLFQVLESAHHNPQPAVHTHWKLPRTTHVRRNGYVGVLREHSRRPSHTAPPRPATCSSIPSNHHTTHHLRFRGNSGHRSISYICSVSKRTAGGAVAAWGCLGPLSWTLRRRLGDVGAHLLPWVCNVRWESKHITRFDIKWRHLEGSLKSPLKDERHSAMAYHNSYNLADFSNQCSLVRYTLGISGSRISFRSIDSDCCSLLSLRSTDSDCCVLMFGVTSSACLRLCFLLTLMLPQLLDPEPTNILSTAVAFHIFPSIGLSVNITPAMRYVPDSATIQHIGRTFSYVMSRELVTIRKE